MKKKSQLSQHGSKENIKTVNKTPIHFKIVISFDPLPTYPKEEWEKRWNFKSFILWKKFLRITESKYKKTRWDNSHLKNR